VSILAASAADVAGLLFVIDSADRQRIKEAQYELENVITSDEMRDVPVQVIANKQDLPSMLANYIISSIFCVGCP